MIYYTQVKEGNEDQQKGLLEKATKGHIDVVRLLLKYGAQPDMRDRDGITASKSFFTSVFDVNFAVAAQIIRTYFRLFFVFLLYHYFFHLVMYACFHGHAGAVKAFLNEGADADFKNMAGRTALQLAQKAGFKEAANAILDGPNIMVLYILVKYHLRR
jgi:ankyrin repeat protein